MIKESSVAELKAKLENKENFIFIDCREQDEWDDAHIEGATLIPLSSFEFKYHEALPDKNAEILIQCRSGSRSLNACMFLNSKGYTNVTNLRGGIIGWMNAGFPVIRK